MKEISDLGTETSFSSEYTKPLGNREDVYLGIS
jgi:hypothetical protein